MRTDFIHFFCSEKDSSDVREIREAVAVPVKQLLFDSPFEDNQVIDLGIAVLGICDDSQLLIRCSEKIRSLNPNVAVILYGEGISGYLAFRCGAVAVISRAEQSSLGMIVSEIFTTQKQAFSSLPYDKVLDLQEKNKELEKINFELDRFVYSASHDLRSPLTSVLGLLYLLREELKDENALKYVLLMEESILKLDNIIRDIVAYSRNNRTEIAAEPIRIKELVKEVTLSLRYLETSGLHLNEVIHVDDAGVFISDKIRLQVILNNLLSNSVKYRHVAKPLKISIQSVFNNGRLSLRISDNGIGINENHIGRIFDMFYRTSEHSTGSGLGLYIVKEMVKKLGGHIEVSSTINEGTSFTISIPVVHKRVLIDNLDESN